MSNRIKGMDRSNDDFNILRIDDFLNHPLVENNEEVDYATSIEIKLPKNTQVLPIQVNSLNFVRIFFFEG